MLCHWGEIDPARLQKSILENRGLLGKDQPALKRLEVINKILTGAECLSLEKSKLRYEEVKLITVKPKSVFASLLEELFAAGQRNFQLAQVLFCHPTSTKSEINSFLHMAMLNPHNFAFVMIGLEHLDAGLQSYFCETFDELYEKWGDCLRFLNLILITNSYNEKIYYHFANHKECKYKVINRACDEKAVAL